MLPILDNVIGSIVLGLGLILSRMVEMSAMNGTKEGINDNISRKGVKIY